MSKDFTPDRRKSGMMERRKSKRISRVTSNRDTDSSFASQGGGGNVRHRLKQLRELEYDAAVKIQAMVKRYLTKKWYLNYVVRKKLCVPFSGLEFE